MPNRQYVLPVSSPGGGSASINFARATLTSAQILAGTIINVVSAPGVGNYVVPLFAIFNYKFKTTPYTVTSETIDIFCNGHSWAQADTTNFIDQIEDEITTSFSNALTTPMPPVATSLISGGNAPIDAASLDNHPISVHVTGGTVTAGDGSVDVLVWYQIVTRA